MFHTSVTKVQLLSLLGYLRSDAVSFQIYFSTSVTWPLFSTLPTQVNESKYKISTANSTDEFKIVLSRIGCPYVLWIFPNSWLPIFIIWVTIAKSWLRPASEEKWLYRLRPKLHEDVEPITARVTCGHGTDIAADIARIFPFPLVTRLWQQEWNVVVVNVRIALKLFSLILFCLRDLVRIRSCNVF